MSPVPLLSRTSAIKVSQLARSTVDDQSIAWMNPSDSVRQSLVDSVNPVNTENKKAFAVEAGFSERSIRQPVLGLNLQFRYSVIAGQ